MLLGSRFTQPGRQRVEGKVGNARGPDPGFDTMNVDDGKRLLGMTPEAALFVAEVVIRSLEHW